MDMPFDEKHTEMSLNVSFSSDAQPLHISIM